MGVVPGGGRRVSESNNKTSGGISLAGATFLVFMVLKLTGYIDWSWWWITAPLWGGLAIALAFVVFAAVVAGVIFITSKALDRWAS